LGIAIILGIKTPAQSPRASQQTSSDSLNVPHIGRIQVLNGCGKTGAAGAFSDFLRNNRFDVKDMQNAEAFNYPFTMVVSRKCDMQVARQVASVLKTDHVILLRNGIDLYDVTVIIGPDYSERIR
jgi:hypothetical protein